MHAPKRQCRESLTALHDVLVAEVAQLEATVRAQGMANFPSDLEAQMEQRRDALKVETALMTAQRRLDACRLEMADDAISHDHAETATIAKDGAGYATRKCPQCESEGKRSKLYMGGMGFVTAMVGEDFYDEDGVRHTHDPNRLSQVGHCSEGHQVRLVHSNRCTAPGCDFGFTEEIVVVDKERLSLFFSPGELENRI